MKTYSYMALAAFLAGNLLQASEAEPAVTIISPKAGQIVTNALFPASGTAKESLSVYYRINGDGWTNATITNVSNWSASIMLVPGPNDISVYAEDSGGKISATNTVSFFYQVLTPLVVNIIGPGKVNPNYKGQSLVIGKPYSISAEPGEGCQFTGWDTNSAPTTRTSSTLKFIMAQGLAITANFRDITKPSISVTAPALIKNSNSVVVLKGTANDNVAVQSVYYTINSGPPNYTVVTTNQFTDWSAVLILSPGPNVVRVYAEDTAEPPNIRGSVSVTLHDLSSGFAPQTLAGTIANFSPSSTSTVGFSGLAPVSTLSVFPPEPSVPFPFAAFFGSATYASIGDSNFATGNYLFSQTDSNTIQLAYQEIIPADSDADGGVATLTFTSTTSGNYTNDTGSGGTFTLSGYAGAAPLSLDGANSSGQWLPSLFPVLAPGVFGSLNLTYGSFWGGTYTYSVYSPQMALLTATFPNPLPGPSPGFAYFVLLNFSGSPPTGSGSFNAIRTSPAPTPPETGSYSFNLMPFPKGNAPESLAGWTAAITSKRTETNNGKVTVAIDTPMACFETAAFGQIDTADTNDLSGVGNYTYTRTGSNTGVLLLNPFVPPPGTNSEAPIMLDFTSRTSAAFTNGNAHGTVTVSQPAATVPTSVAGSILTFKPAQGPTIMASFGYDTVRFLNGGQTQTNTYSFGQYGPRVAMLQIADVSSTNYLTLWFSSSVSGSYVSTKIQSGESISNRTGIFSVK